MCLFGTGRLLGLCSSKLLHTQSALCSTVYYAFESMPCEMTFCSLLSSLETHWVELSLETPPLLLYRALALIRKSFYVMFLNIWKLRNKATNITALKKYTAKDMTTHCSWGLQKISSLIVMVRAATERFDMVKKHWYISPQHGLTGLNLSLRVNITQLMADTSITVSYLW